MANTGLAFLGSLRIQAQQRSDMVNSGFITTVEWNQLLSRSYKELYDLLVTSYGDDYYLALPYAFNTVNNQMQYPLPDGLTTVDAVTGLVAAPLYKLSGVDLMVTSSPNGWVTIDRFEFVERNKFQQSVAYLARGFYTYRYKIVGSNLWLLPTPPTSQLMQLWYTPKPTNLMAEISCGTTSSSTTVTTPDTSQLAVGMSVADLVLAQGATPVIPIGATISSIVTNTSFVVSSPATATASAYILGAWSDTTTLDGISGWEDYVIVDAAMKALIKEESSNVQELMAEKAALRMRIIETAANRDQGMPARVSDTRSTFFGFPDGVDGGDGGAW